jgi:DME family drug/metabolite transporter
MVNALTHGARRDLFLVMLASTLWGTSGVASQGVAHFAPTTPLSISFFRIALAAPFLLFAGYRLLGKQMWNISRRDLALMMFIGALIAADQALYFTAISYAGVTVATLLTICTAPIVVTLFTAIYKRQRPSNFTLFSIALAIVGTVLLVGGSQSTNLQDVSWVGVGLSLLCGLGYAGIIVLGQFLAGRCHPLQVNAIGFSTGAVFLAILVQFGDFVGSYPIEGWGLLLYLGVIPTALAYSLFIVGMRTTPAPIASVLVLLEPLTAAFLSWLLLGEQLGVFGIIGTVMLLIAIYLLSTKDSQTKAEEATATA